MTGQPTEESEPRSAEYKPSPEVIGLIKQYHILVSGILQSLENGPLKVYFLQNKANVELGVTLQDSSFNAILEKLEDGGNISGVGGRKLTGNLSNEKIEIKETGKKTLAWIKENYKDNL